MHHDGMDRVWIRKVVLVERRKIFKHRSLGKGSAREIRALLRNYVGNPAFKVGFVRDYLYINRELSLLDSKSPLWRLSSFFV